MIVTGTEIIVVCWISNKYLVHNGNQIIYEVAFVKGGLISEGVFDFGPIAKKRCHILPLSRKLE